MPRIVSSGALFLALVGLAAQPPGNGSKPGPVTQPPVAKKGEPPAAKAKPGPPAFDVKLADDSTVRVVPLEPTLAVSTKYGKLTIPVADVRRIDFGFRFPEGVEAKVKQAVEDLGAPVFQVREDAQKALLGFAELAVPALKQAVNSSDKEVSTRAGVLLKQLKESLPNEKYNLRDYDKIETAEFSFQGRVEATRLKVATQYFGETILKVADLRSVRGRGPGGEADDTVPVDAARYGRPNDQTWLDTKIEVSAGRPLEVTATGKVDLWPQQAGGYVVTADGQPRQGTAPPIVAANGQSFHFAPGTLIGRIGETGMPFAIGSNYKSARTGLNGKLYLKIAGSPWGNNSTGTYKVTVKAGG
ncbi:MAG TPA: hypothetical protein VGJ05_18270 [Fimbriiglobus sp.]|jgi:hypothetical protein